MPIVDAFLRIRFDHAQQLLLGAEQSFQPAQASLENDVELAKLAGVVHRRRSRLERLMLAVESGCASTIQVPTE